MNQKTTVAAVLLIASLHGQVLSLNEIAIASTKLQILDSQNIHFMEQAGLIRFESEKIILDLAKFDRLSRAYKLQAQLKKTQA